LPTVFISYHRDFGVLSKKFYRNNKLHGECHQWFPDGSDMLVGTYVDGEAHGTLRTSDQKFDGTMQRMESIYNYGVLQIITESSQP
jgi:antitoxin component YwqK of YwqJK toxin-antitoxin module